MPAASSSRARVGAAFCRSAPSLYARPDRRDPAHRRPARTADPIAGTVPDPAHMLPKGCSFAPRCSRADRGLLRRERRRSIVDRPRSPASRPVPSQQAAAPVRPDQRGDGAMSAPLIEVPRPRSQLPGAPRTCSAQPTRCARSTACRLRHARGETLGLVGESGSGKSTLGRMLLGIDAAQARRGACSTASAMPRRTTPEWRTPRAKMQTRLSRIRCAALDRRADDRRPKSGRAPGDPSVCTPKEHRAERGRRIDDARSG